MFYQLLGSVSHHRGHPAGSRQPLADFQGLVNNRAYQAYDRFSDKSVAMHPGDNGMQATADLIWEQIR